MDDEEMMNDNLIDKYRKQRNRLSFLENSIKTYKKTLEQMSTMLDAVSEGVIGFDSNKQISVFNRQFLKMWGLSEDIVEISNEFEIFDELAKKIKDSDDFLDMIQNVLLLNECELYGITHLKDGRVFEFSVNPAIPTDITLGKIWTFKDITEYIKAEERIQSYSYSLEEAMLEIELKKEMLEKTLQQISGKNASKD
jgi:PAS domain S-box-containing protein